MLRQWMQSHKLHISAMACSCTLFRNAHGCALGGVLGVVLVCKEETHQSERECFLCMHVLQSWISMLCCWLQ